MSKSGLWCAASGAAREPHPRGAGRFCRLVLGARGEPDEPAPKAPPAKGHSCVQPSSPPLPRQPQRPPRSSWGGGTAPRGRTPGRRRARARGWATAPPGPRRRRPRGASAPCSEQELLPVREALRLPEREPADGSPATSSACSSGHSRASSQGLPASWPPPPPGDRHRGARRAEEVARQQARHGPQEHGVRRGLLQGVVLHPQGPKLRGHAAELDEPHLREPVACEVAALEVVREDNSTRAPRSMRPPCSTSTSPVSIARSGRAGSRASPCVDAASPRARTSWSTRSPIENRPRGQPKCPRSPSCP
ncbi:unnamed protein product [Prorocentrum cordatum]|uniref:Uncharacterized protein n=1 Tax=Prorocentrum cordatum TaxID=2364126 RepID=A0ABN9VLD9_9DINO|nr:unnamed protein product [Polarella glacialis]